GRFVRLEPYAEPLKEELRRALDCDAESWDLFAASGQGAGFESWWAQAMAEMAAGTRVPFAVRWLRDDRFIGTSSYLSIRPQDRGAEIGSTFYQPHFRGGPVNPECKLLLLSHAFGAGALRMQLVTDGRNLRSQAAIAKLGAVREGVLRRHKITHTGRVRDTVMFSITDQDWPDVRARLDQRLAAF
ncbi:MAG TPA: GNAT family protein, partial [Brevundimonas sp.]|nr:GNAT family protein [Brevundimonas sp.]